MFTHEVREALGVYVYRLIDPRNGETFYIGKGTNNRVFDHVNDRLELKADLVTEKLNRIRAIRNLGLDVIHVIHRHGMDERTAFEVEAALIDAYPEASNLIRGQAAEERGVMHAAEIIARYGAPEAVFIHTAVLITISRARIEERNIYEVVRYAWPLNRERACRCEFVMAVVQGLIVGVYEADEWLAANPVNFPGREEAPRKWGFVGHEAPQEIRDHYIHHRLPRNLRPPGAQFPIRYVEGNL